MENSLSVFGGHGFIGGRFCDRSNKSVIVHSRRDYVPSDPNILNFISTTHNYHVKDGDSFVDIETNLTVLMRILNNARKLYGQDVTFNHISSWFVYGKTECPAREDSQCYPTGFYSITKLASEQLLASYCQTFGMHYRILRLGNVLGVGDRKISRKKNALQYMIQQVSLGETVDYLYDGDFYRDYIDVRDVVRAICLILDKGGLDTIYNIGNGVPQNINKLVYLANRFAGSKSKISTIPVPEFHKVVQVRDMWLDTTKIKSLGYAQEYSIEDTIKELVEHYARP